MSHGTINGTSHGNINPYAHQTAAMTKLSKWSASSTVDRAGLLVLPTGGGKTLTATYWLMKNVLSRGKKVLWIAHRYSLLEQAHAAFELVCDKPYRYRIISGIHDSAHSIRPDDDILIASKASLSVKKKAFRTWLESNRDNFYFVIDEAHHAPAKGYRDLIADMRKYGGKFFMLGLTATPFRTSDDEKGWMKKVFPDDILYRISIADLVSRGILSKPIFERIDTDIDMRKLFTDAHIEEIYNRIIRDSKFDLDGAGADAKIAAALIAENHERNMLIVSQYVANAGKYGKTLVFALNQAMAELLYKYFKAAGVRVGCVISNYGAFANEQTIDDFKSDRLDVLVNVNIVTEGVDVPNVQTVFLTRPTKSKILMTQMIGRGLRGQKVGGTEETYIVDFLDKWLDDLVAWVIPEKLYDEEKDIGSEPSTQTFQYVDDEELDEDELSAWEILRTVSEAMLDEFIRAASVDFDKEIFKPFPFVERIPVGYYQFDYEVFDEDEDGEVKTCNVMVYDCMKPAFDDLMNWLANRPEKNFPDILSTADEIDKTFFGEREKLLGYSKENIFDILRFYNHTEGAELPKWTEFTKRNEYDVAALARHIIANKLDRRAEAAYKNSAWDSADGKWRNFFGEQNKLAFIAAVDAEVERILNPDDFTKPTNELTDDERKAAENLLWKDLRDEKPAIYGKIRDIVYDNFKDGDEYFDQLGRRSKSRLDFDIKYITPLTEGGKTLPENLRLVFKNHELRRAINNVVPGYEPNI